MREYLKAFTCVIFISLICGSILPYTSLSALFLLFNLRNLIYQSWCSTPGLNSGQTAALFISLVINITQCNATFADNYTGNGAPALLQLFFSWPHCCCKSHCCEQQAHSFFCFFFGFSPGCLGFTFFKISLHHLCWMALSLAAGYRAVTALQTGLTAATYLLNNNHVLLWMEASLSPDVIAITGCPSIWGKWTILLLLIYVACSICCWDMN